MKKISLYLGGKQILDERILATHRAEGRTKNRKHFVEINGESVEVKTANQLYSNRLFFKDGKQLTDKNILATHQIVNKGKVIKHFVTIDGLDVEVMTVAQLDNNRLYLSDGTEITDQDILNTHIKEGVGSKTQHFVYISGEKTKVKTAKKLYNDEYKKRLPKTNEFDAYTASSNNLAFLSITHPFSSNQQSRDLGLLGKITKEAIELDNFVLNYLNNTPYEPTTNTNIEEPELFNFFEDKNTDTAAYSSGMQGDDQLIGDNQAGEIINNSYNNEVRFKLPWMNESRPKQKSLFLLDGTQVVDEKIYATHRIEEKANGRRQKHYLMIDGKSVEVQTYQQYCSNQLFFLDGREIRDENLRKTHFVEKVGGRVNHYIVCNNENVLVTTYKQLENRKRKRTPKRRKYSSLENQTTTNSSTLTYNPTLNTNDQPKNNLNNGVLNPVLNNDTLTAPLNQTTEKREYSDSLLSVLEFDFGDFFENENLALSPNTIPTFEMKGDNLTIAQEVFAELPEVNIMNSLKRKREDDQQEIDVDENKKINDSTLSFAESGFGFFNTPPMDFASPLNSDLLSNSKKESTSF